MIYKHLPSFLIKTLYPLCILSLLWQCKKEDDKQDDVIVDECCLPEPTDTLYMSQELKSYFYFPEGSWWVYQRTDTNAAVYDTAKVVRVINEIFYNQFATYAWEKITVVVEHSYYPAPPNSNFVSPNLSVSFQNLNTQVDRIWISSPDLFLGRLNCPLSTPVDADSIFVKSRECGSWSILDSVSKLTIGDSTYSNVLNLNYGKNPVTDELSIIKGIGILKYNCIQCSHEWELINYNIN